MTAPVPHCQSALGWLEARGWDLGPLTHRDVDALAAIAHCWQLLWPFGVADPRPAVDAVDPDRDSVAATAQVARPAAEDRPHQPPRAAGGQGAGPMNHKRGRPKNARAGCLFCKPHKANGAKGRDPSSAVRRTQRGRDERVVLEESMADIRREVDALFGT